ncbi:outer membrane protein [Xanthobacter agilis]|uniref:outer membrane protein n=1 Tax=Xanthobacter agilis TaxID=47492 RepID=UPI00372B1106
MNTWIRTGLLTGAMLWGGAHAAQAQVAATGVPQKGFFVGAGGSVNFSTFTNQDVFAQGLSQIYSGDTLVARGEAGGSTSPDLSGQTDFAPMVQLGYYERFSGSNWLWGAKFTYNYLNASSSQENFLIPQAGYYTGEVSGALAGNVYARSSTMKATNQFALVPFLGYAFDKSFVYFGGGPTLTQIKQELNGLVGFASLFGDRLDLTGAPVSFSSTNWVWGGTVSTGVTYFLAPDWFVDLNYTYTMSTTKTNRFAAPFDTLHDGLTFTGVALGTYSGTTDVQAVMVSINKLF